MDLATIYVSLTLLSFTALLVSVNIARVLRTVAGTRYWYATLVFLALGSVLIALRGRVPNFLSVELANALLIFSPACMIISMSKLRAPDTNPRMALILAAAGSIAYALAAELSGMRARLIAISAANASILSYGVWLLYRVRGVIGANRMMISWLVIMSGFAVARIFVTATADRIGENYLHDSRFQVFYMLAVLASTFGFSAAFIIEVFHRINQDLETERSRLANNSRGKEMILRVISHDLRGPLGVMKQLLAALHEKLTSGADNNPDAWAKEVVDGLQRQAGVTYRLLEDLLTWSQRHTHGTKNPEVTAHIRQIAADALVFHAVEARRKKISLILNANMPDVEIRLDAEGLSMVLRNLISNSLKYSLPGGTIVVDGRVEDSRLVITVTDEGIGVSSGIADKIQAGMNVHSLPGTSGEAGTGVGLSMCRDWLEVVGGKLSVTRSSETHHGTQAEITLPLAVGQIGQTYP